MTKEEKIKESIGITGFLLEYRIGEILKQKDWKVISNRYYLDDLSGVPREIDILAYKGSRVRNIDSYTCLLISCKKSEKNDWVFITKQKAEITNSHFNIISNKWTNDKLLENLEKQPYNNQDLKNRMFSDIDLKSCFTNQNEVFAFQEVDKENQKIQNDKPIFDSINSLVKAVHYELSKLPERNNRAVIFNFHLLSVVETDFYEFHVDGNLTDVKYITQVLYENKFIVDKTERKFLIDFMKSSEFEKRLETYDKIHLTYKIYYDDLLKNFYSDIINSYQKKNLHYQSYGQSISKLVENFLPYSDREMFDILGMTIHQNELHVIELSSAVFYEKTIEQLNSNPKFISSIKQWFKSWYFIDAEIDLKCDDHDYYEGNEDDNQDYFDDYYD